MQHATWHALQAVVTPAWQVLQDAEQPPWQVLQAVCTDASHAEPHTKSAAACQAPSAQRPVQVSLRAAPYVELNSDHGLLPDFVLFGLQNWMLFSVLVLVHPGTLNS